MSEHIDVFLPGHGSGSPFVSLWTDEAVVFFFASVLTDQIFFPDGEPFTLVRFQPESALQMGTGRYLKVQGTIQIERETGSLVGLLNRIGVSSPLIEQKTPIPGASTVVLSELEPSVSTYEPGPRERDEAEEKARRLEAILADLHLQHDPIDWQQAGRLAVVTVNGVIVGDLVTLADDPGRLLDQVRRQLMSAIAFSHLGMERADQFIHLTPRKPATPEMTYLAVVHLDDAPGVPVAEYVRDGKRVYEEYPAMQEGEDAR